MDGWDNAAAGSNCRGLVTDREPIVDPSGHAGLRLDCATKGRLRFGPLDASAGSLTLPLPFGGVRVEWMGAMVGERGNERDRGAFSGSEEGGSSESVGAVVRIVISGCVQVLWCGPAPSRLRFRFRSCAETDERADAPQHGYAEGAKICLAGYRSRLQTRKPNGTFAPLGHEPTGINGSRRRAGRLLRRPRPWTSPRSAASETAARDPHEAGRRICT